MNEENKIVNTFEKGMVTDLPKEYSLSNAYSYALNAVLSDSKENGFAILHNEHSNEFAAKLPSGHKVIGSLEISNNRIIIFSVKSIDNYQSESQISILEPDDSLKVLVNDSTSPVSLKLNFNDFYPIKATYRIKEGCGEVVYWTDNFNRPYSLNISKLENYKTNGVWDKKKFFLQKSFESIPQIKDIVVNDSGGSLKSGSIIPVIQYLDEDLNPSRWINDYKPINIYQVSLNNEYKEIVGSSSSSNIAINSEKTSKSLSVEFENFDRNYPYYRLGFIEYNTGTGEATDIKVSDIISTNITKFTYTGDNYKTKLTINEIYKFNSLISKAKTIEQVDNRLLLGNIEETSINFCELQKIASKINADAVVEEVILNDIEDGSSKNPLINYKKLGYQPGEIYSFGIVCVLEGNIETPVYHIPGKPSTILDDNGNNIADSVTFTSGDYVIPMKSNNYNSNQNYLDENYCNENYWGTDYFGNELKNSPVRHHRFPSRKEANLGFVESFNEDIITKTQTININIELVTPSDCIPATQEQPGSSASEPCPEADVVVTYKVDGVDNEQRFHINAFDLAHPGWNTVFKIENINENATISDVVITYDTSSTAVLSGSYNITEKIVSVNQKKRYKAKILGVRFSNINIPSEINGIKVLGYYIVRNERGKEDKTVLDSGIILPMIYDKKPSDANYVASGMFNPGMNYNTAVLRGGMNNSYWNNDHLDNASRRSKKYFYIVNPSTLFNNEELNIDEIEQQGEYYENRLAHTNFRVLDVRDGTTKTENDDLEDNDGWSLRTAIRDTEVGYTENNIKRFNFQKTSINYSKRLKPLSRYIDDDYQTFNLSLDNTHTIVKLNTPLDATEDELKEKFPYVYIKRIKEDNYYNFRLKPYYKISNSVRTGDVTTEFGGDTHINSMRLATSSFYKYSQGMRGTKSSFWDFVVAIVTVVAAIVLFVPSGGTSLALIPLAYSFAKTGITKEKLTSAFMEHYKKGLNKSLLDRYAYESFEYTRDGLNSSPHGFSTLGVEDDEINMYGEVLTNVWFESQINIDLRLKLKGNNTTSFLESPGSIETDDTIDEIWRDKVWLDNSWTTNEDNFYVLRDKEVLPKTVVGNYFLEKMTNINDEGKREFVLSKPEFYELNPDYNSLNISYPYYHVPREYDCCSKCNNRFKNRIIYSQKSFDEEKTDNYKVFLPNNYKDIKSNTGGIKNLISYYDNLYIFTDTIYRAIRSHQERVTGDIVSFIGTGTYLEQDPKTIIDDKNFGNIPVLSTIKTPNGILIISLNNKKIYLLEPQGRLVDITGMNSSLFKSILKENFKEQVESLKQTFTYEDRPTAKFGEGFIAVYDSKFDRIIISKKDFKVVLPDITGEDSRLCYNNGGLYSFLNFSHSISIKENDGWTYAGIIDCKLKFWKYETTQDTITFYNSGNLETITVPKLNKVYDYIRPSGIVGDTINYGSTISYNLKLNSWVSFHSYLPNIYIQGKEKFYSFIYSSDNIWKHNINNNFNRFYNETKDFVIESIMNLKNRNTFIAEDIVVRAIQEKFNSIDKSYYELKEFFNEAIIYNSKQSSGKLILSLEDIENQNYLFNSVANNNLNNIKVSKNEMEYSFNNFRDFTNKDNSPLFIENIVQLQPEYFTDKVLNTNKFIQNINWKELERFRDKYLVVRLIFNKFVGVKFNLYNIKVSTKKSHR